MLSLKYYYERLKTSFIYTFLAGRETVTHGYVICVTTLIFQNPFLIQA